jgi:hypothetical protein
VDRIATLIVETGRRGFHFVDEAAPPHGLKDLALALLERRVTISWWGNIRFEEAFTPDLCRLLAASGCVAVSAGLEAASDRLLAEMKKGITVDQTARVARAFHDAGILVHAYLMYGLPGETIAETVEALERVRQLFAAGLIQSAFWHKFVATAHSPVGLDPAAHGIRITGPSFGGFAENDLTHDDPVGRAPAWLGEGLRRATMNYLEGQGLTLPVQKWFAKFVPAPRVSKQWAVRVVKVIRQHGADAERRLVWIGGVPVAEPAGRGRCRMILPTRTDDVTVDVPSAQAVWLVELLRASTPMAGARYPVWKDVAAARAGEAFMKTAGWKKVRAAGLLLV